MTAPMLIARRDGDFVLLPRMANRHGLVAGATGTGKTVTLQRIAEQFSRLGVPVFMADVKGDLSGVSKPGKHHPKVQERVEMLSLEGFEFQGNPVAFWDVFGEQGHPVRATISDMGPMLLGRLLDLNETQSGILSIAFKIADDSGMLLLDMKDLRAMLQFIGDNSKAFQTEYGNISAASIGAIQRRLIEIEEQGGDQFFGEPALKLDDLMQVDRDGHGVINILAANRLMQSPKIYSTFLLWLLAELFEQLPEVGDAEKPKLVFFFDEAHLMFDDTPEALLEKIEQVVRLIRSKGVGLYFITQSPMDIPDSVLGQLGNRVQHALRAYTPRDQKAVRAAAQTFRTNPDLDVESVITELGVGDALVSFLDAKGIPGIVHRAWVIPPTSQIGPIDDDERRDIIKRSQFFGDYEETKDRESAYEMLKARAEKAEQDAEEVRRREAEEEEREQREKERSRSSSRSSGSRKKDTASTAFFKSAFRSAGRTIGRELVRGVMGSLKK